MISAGTGVSKDDDAFEAGYGACSQALQKTNIDKPDLVFAFASVKYNQEKMIEGIRDASGNAPLVGCSSAGEITEESPHEEAVVVIVVASDVITFTYDVSERVSEGARIAGQEVAQKVQKNAPGELEAFLTFPDVLTGNGADIVRGVRDELGEHFPVIGGAAGDDFLFEKTYQYADDQVISGGVTGVGLSGDFALGVGVRHGWMPAGTPRTVTKSDGAELYELDNEPAIELYREYFGEKTEKLQEEPLARIAITYPLGIKVPDLDEYLIRDPITVNEDGSITCAAEIPEGSEIRIMVGNKEKAIDAAEDAAKKLMNDFEAQNAEPEMVLLFNCIAREKLFGQRAQDEIDTIRNTIGDNVPIAGFYTYGEQAPLGGEVLDKEKIQSQFYNETVVICALGE